MTKKDCLLVIGLLAAMGVVALVAPWIKAIPEGYVLMGMFGTGFVSLVGVGLASDDPSGDSQALALGAVVIAIWFLLKALSSP